METKGQNTEIKTWTGEKTGTGVQMCSWAQRDQTDTWTREVNSEEVENTVNINILYFQDVFIIIHFIFQVLVNKTRFISAHHDDIINRGHKNNTNMLLHQNFFFLKIQV